MNYLKRSDLPCYFPCTVDDIDSAGNCICDRQIKTLPKVELFSLVGTLNKQKQRLKHIELHYLDERNMKCITISDAICSLSAAIEKLSRLLTVSKNKPINMDEITVMLSPDEFVLITNLVKRIQIDKNLRKEIIPMDANRNPFFLSKLNSKLEQLVPNAMFNSKINNDSIF